MKSRTAALHPFDLIQILQDLPDLSSIVGLTPGPAQLFRILSQHTETTPDRIHQQIPESLHQRTQYLETDGGTLERQILMGRSLGRVQSFEQVHPIVNPRGLPGSWTPGFPSLEEKIRSTCQRNIPPVPSMDFVRFRPHSVNLFPGHQTFSGRAAKTGGRRVPEQTEPGDT